jgi:ketosteroid isomerase-like protein
MNQQSLETFCDRWLASWTGNRPEALLAFYSDDAFYSDPAFPAGLRGHDALRGYLEKLLARNPSWVWTRERLQPTAEGFTLKWRARLPDGSTFNGLDIVETDGARITHNEVYFDPAPLRAPRARFADTAAATAFAHAWIAAWNARDLDTVLALFADDTRFTSPKAQALTGTPTLNGKDALRNYWSLALQRIEQLQFTFEDLCWDAATNQLSVRYVAQLNAQRHRAVELWRFGHDGLIVAGEAFYGSDAAGTTAPA